MKKIVFLFCLLFGYNSFSQELSVIKTSSREIGEKTVTNSTISIKDRIIEFNIETVKEINTVKMVYQDKTKSIYELESNKNIRFTYIKDGKNHLLLKEIKNTAHNKVDEFYYFLQ